MTFKYQGRTYDTSEMACFETGNPASPVLYLTDSGQVFVVEIERLEGINIRLAGSDEGKMLADRHGFRDQLSAAMVLEQTEGATKHHALIVEDDGYARQALSRLLRYSGYESTYAATVAEAETKLKDLPRWLILDLQLPDGRGTALLERVRAENLPIKVAVTTGETDREVLAQVSKFSPDVIFHKPLDLPQIMNWLEAA